MWFAPVASLLALAAIGPEAGSRSSAPATALPEPIATRQTLFSIPFRLERAADPSQEPVEVQLFASGDRGATWHLYSKVEPARQRFMFRAGGDGEYWFQIRTLDRANRLRPEQSNTPGLRVVVDTVAPELQIDAQRGTAGQIVARWRLRDPNLKTDGLTIQYRTSATGPWQSVAISPQNSRVEGDTQTGEVTWWPQPGSGDIQVRAEGTDLAGNPAVSHAQVKATPQNVPGPTQTASDTISPWRPGTTTPLTGPGSTAATVESRYGTTPATPVSTTADRYGRPPSVGSGMGSTANLPPGERPRMVNSRLFELQYDIDSIGPSGIARIELWGTRDNGRTWRSYAVDEGSRSPLMVNVDEEGFYGFRIVVTSRTGPSGRPPQSGDQPEIIVGVDMTKPNAQITSVEQGCGPDAGKLVISWQAEDRMLLAARPTSLMFSETPGGPWTTIAAGLENTGRYAWSLDRRLPPQIYLRLEVRDEAGNVAEFETKDPVHGMNPAVQVRDVRAVGPSSARSPEPQRYYLR